MLPSAIAPPITTIDAMRSTRSGASRSAIAMLVSGPSAQMVRPSEGAARNRSNNAVTACPAANGVAGGGSSAPASPSGPQTNSAVTSGNTIGAAHPAYTGSSGRPANSVMRLAFAAVCATGTLPATAVTASTSKRSGKPSASRIASASSWPGSVSMTIGNARRHGQAASALLFMIIWPMSSALSPSIGRSWILRPLRMITTRVATATTSRMLWLTRITVRPSAFR